jgi:HEAT repeat protein
MACVLYASDGKTIEAAGLITDDKLVGRWRIFEAGAVRREIDTTSYEIEQAVTGEGLMWSLAEATYRADERGFDSLPGLAGIEQEPWDETSGAFDEDVERFPGLVRALASPDPLIRRYALALVEGEIEHQGAVYPATARVIPYLARLLVDPRVDRASLLDLIQRCGEAALLVVERVVELEADDDERIAIDGTLNAIATAWPDIFGVFASSSLDDRRRIFAMAKFAPDASPLVEIARNDRDLAMRVRAIAALASRPRYALADLMPLLADKDVVVRASAAIAIGCTKGPAAPREVIRTLDEVLRGWRDIAGRYSEVAEGNTHVLADVAVALGTIGTPDARSFIPQLLPLLEEMDGSAAITFGDGLLALALGEGKRPFAKRFVEVLETLARSTRFWTAGSKASELLHDWNLPDTPSRLIALVGQLRTAPDPEGAMHARLRE